MKFGDLATTQIYDIAPRNGCVEAYTETGVVVDVGFPEHFGDSKFAIVSSRGGEYVVSHLKSGKRIACGNTEEKALDNAREAVSHYHEDLLERIIAKAVKESENYRATIWEEAEYLYKG